MASFYVSVYDWGTDYVTFRASFTGGDANYSNYRYVKLTMDGETRTIWSDEAGGANSYFEYTWYGLSAGTTYSWSAVLCYSNGSPPPYIETSYTDSGTVTTDANASNAYVYVGGNWVNAVPYVYNGVSWVPTTSEIYDGGWTT